MKDCNFLEVDGSCNCYDPRIQQIKEKHFCKDNPYCYYKKSVLFRDCLLDIYNYKLSKHDIAKKIEECFSKFQELQKLVKKKLRIVKGGK